MLLLCMWFWNPRLNDEIFFTVTHRKMMMKMTMHHLNKCEVSRGSHKVTNWISHQEFEIYTPEWRLLYVPPLNSWRLFKEMVDQWNITYPCAAIFTSLPTPIRLPTNHVHLTREQALYYLHPPSKPKWKSITFLFCKPLRILKETVQVRNFC